MEKIVSSDLVRQRVAEIWPDQKFVVLSDPRWLPPSIEDLKRVLDEYAPDRPAYLPALFECEEFSVDFMATVRRSRAQAAVDGRIRPGEMINWPLGIVVGTRFRGVDMDHWLNICLTDTGLAMIEPQTGHIWRPEPENDRIYFLLM